MDEEFRSLQGKLLIASPTLIDPNFHRTVVLVTGHTAEGAMGVVLNRPSPLGVDEAAPPLASLLETGARVHLGGPVQPQAVVVLAEFDDPSQAATLAFDDVGFIRADGERSEQAGHTRRARVFAGYSGWDSGQLEVELAQSAWIVEPALAADVFTAEPEDLWSSVLRRKGGAFAVLALMPLDPSLN